MARASKHGWDAGMKTRYPANRKLAWFVCLCWLLSTLACSSGYISSAQLTATALAAPTREITAAPTQPATAVLPSTPSAPPETTPIAADLPDAATATTTPTRLPRTPTNTATPGPSPTPRPPILYYSQAGDTLPVLALRFGVAITEITSPDPLPEDSFIRSGQLLLIPNRLDMDPGELRVTLIPDSEIVYSPSAVNFNIKNFVKDKGGYLSSYSEWLSTGGYSGAEVVERAAIENSINPRLLLALVEYRGNWVTGQPRSLAEEYFPVGLADNNKKGLYKQLSWAVEQLSIGYYGWQNGRLTELEFTDGSTIRLWPEANAGTVAIGYLFSRLYDADNWREVMFSKDNGFPAFYQQMFGNPWLRAETVEPLFPADFTQPDLTLPFPPGESWAFTGGPHPAWGPNGALAAVDFAPPASSSGCVETNRWAVAAATGLVVRTGNGIVVLDLDGDGYEQTGWVLLYLHVASKGRVEVGTWVTLGDKIGHPSCEGGQSTGTHVHFARKYNGQWILADGPVPMMLSGWRVRAGDEPYLGQMEKDGKTVTASTSGSSETLVRRD